MKINVELLKEVAQYIVENPNSLNMSHYYDRQLSISGCRDTACIGGLAVFLAEGNGRTMHETLNGRNGAWPMEGGTGQLGFAAAKLLFGHEKLMDPVCHSLFHIADWPAEYHEAYVNAPTSGIKAKVAADYIHYFIKQNTTAE